MVIPARQPMTEEPRGPRRTWRLTSYGSGLGGALHLAAMLVLALVSCGLRLVAAPSFTARIEPDNVAAGESATLQLVFTDCGRIGAPQLPPIANATIQFSGSSQQHSIVNGTSSSSVVHQYTVQPNAAGTVEIPGLAVEVDGKRLVSNPVTLRVGKGLELSEIGFVKVVTPKPDYYLGETFPVDVKFYFRQSPQDVAANPVLRMDGFTIDQQGKRQSGQERIGADIYGVVTWRLSLTPVKTGELRLGPAEVETIFVLQSRNRNRDPFARFFGNGGEQRRLTFASETNTLRVMAPPAAGRPAGFNGAVGRFTLALTASPTNVSVGDPVTVRLKVRGRGNFRALRLPDFPPGKGFQSYAGTNSFEPTDELGLEGVKTFEQVLVPEHGDITEVAWPPFSFWNPDAKRYETLDERPVPLKVRGSLAAQVQPVGNIPSASSSPASRPVANEFRPLATRIGAWSGTRAPVVQQPWFIGLLALPPTAYLALVVALRIRSRPRDTSRTVRQRQEQSAVEALRTLSTPARAGDAEAFSAALNRAVQERLALTLGGPAGAFTADVVETRLVRDGFPDEDAERLRRIFAALDLARYSRNATGSELESLRTDAEAVEAALRRWEGKR